jgi:tetratricopeptide (TPR) repeat protein
MNDGTDSSETLGRNARTRRGRASATGADAEDARLAALHLRLGCLSLARAELEELLRRGGLGEAGLADLAEARWRSGDLDVAAGAAAEHLAAGGSRPVALAIAAEAAAAAGDPVEARAHVEALEGVDAAALESLFAGMPRRAPWSAAPRSTPGPPEAQTAPARPHRGRRAGRTAAGWSAGPSVAGGARSGIRGLPPESADELSRARQELSSGIPGEAARGVARLALVLHLDPVLAPAVLEVLKPRRDPAALLVRGDAYRLLGRHLEAEAAFHAAGQALDALDAGRPS